MRYADPQACPRCRQPIGGVVECPSCSFDLTSPAAQELWSLFVRADQVLEASRTTSGTADQERVSVSASAPVAAARPKVAREPRKWSTGALLLGLGAVSLIVAAIIFVSLNWGSLGIAGRTLVLLGITSIFAVLLTVALRMRLFSSAEALAFVLLAMVVMDVLGAAAAEFLGLGKVSVGGLAAIVTGVVAVVAFVVVRAARDKGARTSYVSESFAALTLGTATPFMAHSATQKLVGWSHGSGTVFMLVGAAMLTGSFLLLRVTGHVVATKVSGVLAGLWAAATIFVSWADYFDAPGVWHTLSSSALLVVIAGLVVGGYVIREVRVAAWTLAILSMIEFVVIGFLRIQWDWDSKDVSVESFFSFGEWAAAAGLALSAFALTVASTKAKDWNRAIDWSFGALLVVLLLSWFSLLRPLSLRADQEWFGLDVPAAGLPEKLFGSAILVLLAAVTALAVLRAREGVAQLASIPRHARMLLATGVCGLALADVLALVGAPQVLVALAFVGCAAVWSLLLSNSHRVSQLFVLAPASVALALMPSTYPLDALVALLVAAVVLHAGWRSGHEAVDGKGTVVAALLGAFGALPLVWALARFLWSTGDGDVISVGLTFGLIGALHVVALGIQGWSGLRAGFDAGLGFSLLAGLLWVQFDMADSAGTLTALGFGAGAVATAVVALSDASRRWQYWLAAALGTLSWWTLLFAHDVAVVEWYTIPVALAVLGLGLAKLGGDPDSRTWPTLSPGLLLGLLPSLVMATDEPTGLRALLCGIVALAVLLAGVQLRWQAAVVIGGAVFLGIALLNVGPVVMALHRWILFASAGVLLVLLGTTWEKRVQNGRAVAGFISKMR